MRLEQLKVDYLNYVCHELGLANKTYTTYQSWLNNFIRWLKQNGYAEPTVAEFNTPTLRRYLYYLSTNGLRPRTIRGAFHPLRGLGKYLMASGAIAEDPVRLVTLPKKDAAIRLTVTDEEIERLLEATTRIRDKRKTSLAKAVLGVLVYSGLRRQELLDLQIDDVSLSEKTLLVRSGKGGKSRKLYVADDLVDALAEWTTLYRPKGSSPFLFAIDKSRRLAEEGLRLLLEEIKAIAGLAGSENIKPHSLRHACATRLLRNGADLRSIQSFLGHSSLAVTSVYLHTDEQQLRSVRNLAALTKPGDLSSSSSTRSVRQIVRG